MIRGPEDEDDKTTHIETDGDVNVTGNDDGGSTDGDDEGDEDEDA